MKQPISRLVAGALLAGATLLAQAQLAIEITGAGAQRLPIAIADFAGERVPAAALTSVIRADLERSGRFNLVNAAAPALDENSPPDFGEWKNRGADALAAGSLTSLPDGRYETRFRLYDIQKQAAIGGLALAHTSSQIRATAHRIADAIYEKLTGERGIFSTRIA
ncbi:MAG: Tol-Pal system protein TolB, partial [Rhodocyclaceae bacterium]